MADRDRFDDADGRVTREADEDAVEPDRTAGEVLGVSHVKPEGTLLPRSEDAGEGGGHDSEFDQPHGLGSRDVTDGTTGGTNTDAGGAGPGARELRRGSGATGTDIGK